MHHMCAGELLIMNFGALPVYLWVSPLVVGGDHVKPSLYGSINHPFMLPHQHALYVCWGATYHEFWGPSCVSVSVPSQIGG